VAYVDVADPDSLRVIPDCEPETLLREGPHPAEADSRLEPCGSLFHYTGTSIAIAESL